MRAVLAIVIMSGALFSCRLTRNTPQPKVTRAGSDDFRDNTNKQVFYARCGYAAVVCALCAAAGGAYAIHKMKQPKSMMDHTEFDPFLLCDPYNERFAGTNPNPDADLVAAYKSGQITGTELLARCVLRNCADTPPSPVTDDDE